MLGFGALNNDTEETSERQTPIELIQEAQESEALALYHQALSFQKAGDTQEAEKIYSDVLHTDLLTKVPSPSKLNAEEVLENSGLLLKYTVYKNLGDISYSVEDHEKALDNYLEAALIDESDVSLWWRIGDIALKVTNLKLARYSFEKGLFYSPKHWPCLDNLVTVLFAIGDYAACLEVIAKGLENDSMFVKGLIIRDQIFKEECHFRREYQDFQILFENENREEYYDDDCVKFIEEALVLREKRCLLSRKEDLPRIKLSKPLTYFTWACLGDCLIHQYDELTNPDNPKSLCNPLDIEKYSKSPEQQASLPIPSPETSWKGAKPTSKEEERKSLKRKKIQASLFEKESEPIAKRRSARVKSSKKEEDINWAETLQSFLPEFLRPDSATENEDSQDSMAEDMGMPTTSSSLEYSQRTSDEAKAVSDFINKNIRNSGCVDLMSKFIRVVALHTETSGKWFHGLPHIYSQIFKRVKKHIQFPNIPMRKGCEKEFSLFAKSLLYALELQLDEWLAVKSKVPVTLSPGKPSLKAKKSEAKSMDEKPKGTDDFLKDLQYLMLMMAFEDAFDKQWVQLLIRYSESHRQNEECRQVQTMAPCAKKVDNSLVDEVEHVLLLVDFCRQIEYIFVGHWLGARFHMLTCENRQSMRAFDKCIAVLTPENGINKETNLKIILENCMCDSVISLETVQRKLETFQRCLSLLEVNKLYEDEKYAEVVDLLMPLLKQRKSSLKLPATHLRPSADIEGKLKLVQLFIHCGTGDLEKFIWKHGCVRSPETEATSSPAERPTQLLLLQDSLSKLGQIKKCIICSEIAIKEAVEQMTPTEDWKILINGFLDCLNRSISNGILTNDALPKTVMFGLVQSMIRIVEISMDSFDNNELVLATTVPWLVLYKIIKSFDPSSEANEKCFSAMREMLAADDHRMPKSFHFIKSCHDILGRRGLCCDDDGILLLAFSKDLKIISQYLMPMSKKEDVLRELEQCFYCLYGHPSKKTKSRRLQDHVTSQTSLTWEYAQIVYDHFKPAGLPTLDNKVNTISMEVQLLLRRIVAVVPQKEVEVISFDALQSYIDGLSDIPTFSSENIKETQVQDLFYYLGDYYFKNKEFSKAIKFYMHDICMNPTRFESWAAMALGRGSRLEEKISAHEPKSDGPIRKNIVSTLRCFEKAVELNDRNCMILEEYGSTSYMLNSQAARRLRELIQDEEYTSEAALSLIERRKEMLRLAEKCFTQAKSLVRRAEGEPWLHSYMLGKTAERLEKSHKIFLDYYQLAAHQLYIANANYPKRIPYHNPPGYSIESLEMFYRIHASIINIFLQNPDHIDYDLIEEYLDRAEKSPFALGVNFKSTEKISKDEPSQDISTQQCPSETTMESSSSQLQNDQESSVAKDHSLEEREDSNEASINSKNECYFQESQSLFSDNSESTLCQTYEKPTQEIDQSQLATKQDVPSQIAAANAMSSSERTILGFLDVSQELACNPEDSNIDSQKKAILDKESGIPSKSANASDGTIGSEIETNNDREENVVEKNPNVKGSLLKRSFATTRDEIRYKTIVDRCMSAFAVCLKRFPEHYKSQYKIAYVATYFETHRDLQYGRDLLIGSSSNLEKHSKFVPQHGLFTDRSKTNLFQYLWRIPIDEVDRRGSFCSHICKAVELLLHVVSELKEWDTLLAVSSLLHLTPNKDKKYLRDNDRLFLALKAFDIAKDILKRRIESATALSRTEQKLLLLDCFEAYKHAQKMQTSVQITEHFLTKLFRMLLHETEKSPEMSPLPDKLVFERAIQFCVENAESGRKLSAANTAAASSQSTMEHVNKQGPSEKSQSA